MSSKELIIAACERGDFPQLERVLEETELDVGSEPLGSEGETALHVACAHGHLDMVLYLVNDRGCSVAVPNSGAVGATPLEVAWANKHWEIVKFLLNAIQCRGLFAEVGLAPTTVTQLQEVAKYGDEALHQACLHGYLEAVKFLTCSDYLHLKNKKEHGPTAVSSHITTPLQVAWENKHWEVASCLLQVMVRECHKQVSGLSQTALTQLLEVVAFGEETFHVACSRGALEVVQYLHKYLKCSLTQHNAQGETPLDIARLNGQLYVIHFLLESAKCSAPDMTELHIACMGRDEEKVRVLASDITSISIPDQYGITAVHYATYQPKNLRILVSIAEQKHRLSLLVRQDGRGNTPLHYAASCGRKKSVKSLMSYYKFVDMQNSDGDTPLHLSIKSSYCHSISHVESFLNHKDIALNIQNREGNTPLHEAVMRQVPVNVVEALTLHKSCNPSIANNAGKTPLQISIASGELDYAEVLITSEKCSCEDIVKATEGTLLLHRAVLSNRFKSITVSEMKFPDDPFSVYALLILRNKKSFIMLEQLVKNSRCDFNAQDQHGNTALHIAVYSGTDVAEKVQCILQSERCNPNITNYKELTPLHVAVENKQFQSAAMLLKHSNCNPNIQDLSGNTPLHLSISSMSLSDVEVFLIHKYIDLNIQNNRGDTVLHIAVLRESPLEVVAALILHKSCNPYIANFEGMTPLQTAVGSQIMGITAVLITSKKCSQEDLAKAIEDASLLMYAVLQEKAELLTALIEAGVNVNASNSKGETALHIACKKGNSKAAKLLLQNGADVVAVDHKGNAPIHVACESRTLKCLNLLLSHHACNPNQQNAVGDTPLHILCNYKLTRDMSMLCTGDTPLHLSISKMSLCNVDPFLVHDKIDLDIQNQYGETILHKAIMGDTPVDVVKALTQHKSCNPSIANYAGITPLQNAIVLGQMGHVEVLITSGKCSQGDIEMAVKDKLLLHQAVALQQVNLFLALINLTECNVVTTDSNGETLLHAVCRVSHCKVILESLVGDSRHDVNAQNTSGDTALHVTVSSKSDNAEKVQCILQSERCNPNITNYKGFTPLHVAVENKQFQSAAMLLKHSNCNPNIRDLSGNTPLHLSIGSMSLSDVEVFLIHKYIDLNIQNNHGDTVLHIAALRESPLEVVTALIFHKSCNPYIANSEGMTPLQTAVGSQIMGITAVLITSKKCSQEDLAKVIEDASLLMYAVLQEKAELLTALIEAGVNVNASNSKGETALHIACKKGNSKAAKLLLQNGADVVAVDHKGNAPIHVACGSRTLECLHLLLSHHACNPNQQNAVGDTLLHILCNYKLTRDMSMLRTLLSAPGINIECANHAGQIPAELAKSNYFVIEEISSFLKHKNTELETYLKIFVVGNSGGGKSTLIKAVTTEESKSWKSVFKTKHVNLSDVPLHTAGIVPLRFKSQHFGHAVLYDFAGQHEYYSSHAAVMENLVMPSPPLFLLLIDISKPMEEIREELIYWWMFINNHSKRATVPHVILVGSHKDIVKERRGDVEKTMKQITDIVRDIPVSFQFDHSKAFPLDCRKLVSRGLTALLTQLKLTCKTLRQTADIDLHCHILKTFLTTNFHSSVACEVSEISEKTNPEDDLLPQEPSQLIPLLSTLSDKGHILLLENHTDVSKSWVVLKPELLLAEVNGSIFAPDNFKEHCSGFAMSTGVVALSKIQEKFGEHNNQIIIGYLTHLEFCFQMKDQNTLEMITKDATLQLITQGSEQAEEYYFFPSLIQKKTPSDVCQPQETIKYECGWFYTCNEPTEHLTTRFLHVLILRLAFSCDPPDEPTERESVVLLRSCSVWKHGIAWWTNDGIETIVEVGLQCRWIAVMLRCPDTHKVQCAELRTNVISTVLKTKQDFCPAIGMKEFLIAPSSLQYPFEGRELTLYSMKEIAKIIIAGKEFPKDTEGRSTIHISQLLPFEPFFNFGENLVDSLFTPGQRNMSPTKPNFIMMAKRCYEKLDDFKKALNPDQFAFQRECVKPDCTEVDRCVALFQIIQRRGCKTWRDFEEEFSRFSVFCGRNPMVSENLMV